MKKQKTESSSMLVFSAAKWIICFKLNDKHDWINDQRKISYSQRAVNNNNDGLFPGPISTTTPHHSSLVWIGLLSLLRDYLNDDAHYRQSQDSSRMRRRPAVHVVTSCRKRRAKRDKTRTLQRLPVSSADFHWFRPWKLIQITVTNDNRPSGWDGYG